ncbi:MAG: NAD-dependent epimerase/dehydratase family protein [Actinomycetota bacterium]|nr:NAD-dependent epimerase/dehydratase family protein [Actinomycetota bacterium]MCL6092863.1 NAD-dependent epimerase/dehydratase family protein [Actinomycetota bacterium]MDA8166433.1 NAD-dependent epimerase/dehydratase family protein [Actinomycetota bacterium]
MKILVLGGDGFCGWPTALHLSAAGHNVAIVDNLSRRKIDWELGTSSLTPMAALPDRLSAWKSLTGRTIAFELIDIAQEYARLLALIEDYQPDTIIHFAEQRAAPYSMKSADTKRYTVNNNTNATHNILCSLVDSGVDAHLVHLGTMGVYGYGWSGSMTVPEGYIEVKFVGKEGELKREILHPANPGSVYHMTKTLDQLMFAFYAKNDGIRVTDLHQGIVWGTQTPETEIDELLINRFDYDGDYGTVLNRFLMQAAIGHPLTVYGSGGQTRAFIHIRDTVRCIELAILNPPAPGAKPTIFNQVTETYRLRDLAALVSGLTGAKIDHLENPRVEADENELVVDNSKFLALGLNATTLSQGLLTEVHDIAGKYVARVDRSTILPTSRWRQERAEAGEFPLAKPTAKTAS